jgi:hypothetical protein
LPTPSARLSLLKPAESDPFVTDDIADNWQKIDDHPGARVCLSTSRPVWTNAQAGMLISETDTGLLWRWTGSAWARPYPTGRLRTTSGGWAYAARTTLFSTASSSAYVVALTLANVVVPDGLRPIEVEAAWDNAVNANGYFFGLIVRSAAVGGPATGATHQVAAGSCGSYVGDEPAGLAANTYTWTYQVKAVAGGTAQLSGLSLRVREV